MLVAMTVAQAWMSVKNNQRPGSWSVWMYVVGLIPIWTWVSARSKSLMFDAMLYDSLQVILYSATIAFMIQKAMTPANWAGVGLVIIGLLLLKL